MGGVNAPRALAAAAHISECVCLHINHIENSIRVCACRMFFPFYLLSTLFSRLSYSLLVRLMLDIFDIYIKNAGCVALKRMV